MDIKEKLTSMFNIKSGFLPACLLSAAVIGAALTGYPATANAQTLQEIAFSSPSSQMADAVYMNYLRSLGEDPTTMTLDPAYSRYVPLDESNPQRFLGYYVVNGIGGECAQGGCEVLIFEQTRPNEWQLVLHALARDVFIDQQSPSPRDIYTRANPVQPGEPDDIMSVWGWRNDEYKFEEDYNP